MFTDAMTELEILVEHSAKRERYGLGVLLSNLNHDLDQMSVRDNHTFK